MSVTAGLPPARDVPSSQDQRPGWLRVVPFLVVMAMVIFGFVLILMYHWKRGTVTLAGGLFLAAVFRAALPPEVCLLLAIRSRPIDVLTYGGFATMITYVAMTIGP
ncbi:MULTISPECIES: DUF3017 domain-containing protein [unclassified Crossiella]|uniref:DUF3017 domain-containing protein n=1 Tax=unclassified Crossiella TaxID=2620835 RepID=UPI0020002991|nr:MULTISPECIES: DUF3017 domain-containing protein [unclassified Crossiella]MCK2237007.1 DUF3017 domain-containing protein [Crossiella sp. S99.2]MCK2250675.1 DUF3017 domain-containing protein [Crossiella sp. S99.1]